MGNHRAVAISASFRCHGALIAQAVARLIQDDSGQGTVEYILILSMTVVGAGAISRKLLEVFDRGILKLGGQLERDLKTGRAPVGIWQN